MDGRLLIGIGLGLLVTWAALLLLLWLVRPRNVPLRQLLSVVPDVLRLIRDLIADRSMPLRVRAALVGLLAWMVSPIDLIPEFIPVLGPLDDVIVAVLVLRYVQRQVGQAELRRRWRGSDPGFAVLVRVLGAAGPESRSSTASPRADRR
jgi:uncharacterized membrane protein YkvA (DUF1232 family)